MTRLCTTPSKRRVKSVMRTDITGYNHKVHDDDKDKTHIAIATKFAKDVGQLTKNSVNFMNFESVTIGGAGGPGGTGGAYKPLSMCFEPGSGGKGGTGGRGGYPGGQGGDGGAGGYPRGQGGDGGRGGSGKRGTSHRDGSRDRGEPGGRGGSGGSSGDEDPLKAILKIIMIILLIILIVIAGFYFFKMAYSTLTDPGFKPCPGTTGGPKYDSARDCYKD